MMKGELDPNGRVQTERIDSNGDDDPIPSKQQQHQQQKHQQQQQRQQQQQQQYEKPRIPTLQPYCGPCND